ncbi:hypothetical protein [Gayadomonas joobiniege]|uniref:hypothetical protein n=1 Tax=Gayadomonas joobiniege TaxID=1234606 RepID=UPI0003806DD2|nr:hypothetical protein [Gayadomonas joobiniege]
MSLDLIIPFIERRAQNQLKPKNMVISRIQKEQKIDADEKEDKYYQHRLPVRARVQNQPKEDDGKHHHIDIMV